MTTGNEGRGNPHHEHDGNTTGHEPHHLHDADGENQAWFTNRKRTYDTYQEEDLENRAASRDHARNVNNIAEQALQNAVTQANLVTLQAIAHRDVAVNKTWNINETDLIAANAITSGSAINAAIAKHVEDSHPG